MKNVYLFQAQSLIYNKDNIATAWLPYATARLWAYASSFDEIKQNFCLKKIFPIREPFDIILSQLDDPKVCGFACYVWNLNYNLELAKQIKHRWPDCQILFGGPSVTPETFNEYPIIDSTIEGEGEFLFKQYLDDVLVGAQKSQYSKARIRNLSELVSPYTLDIFDQIINEYPNHLWFTSMETNRGCPYHCTFCDWGSATNSKVFLFDLDTIKTELSWIESKKTVVQSLTLADANFGIYKERDLTIAKMIAEMKLPGYVTASWSKTYNQYLPEIYNIIGKLNKGLTVISLQSSHKETLDAIKRKNLTDDHISKLLDSGRKNNISINHEYILGLPLETKESWYNTITEFLDHGYNRMTLVYFCSLLPNTELASKESIEKYKIETVKTIEPDWCHHNINDVSEYSEIIKSTSTMTTEELIECYLFSIILTHTYNAGYTRLVFMIGNKNYDINGLDFYRRMEELLYKDPVIGPHLEFLKSILREMFTTGVITNPDFVRGVRFDYISYPLFYKQKDKILDMALQVFTELISCDDKILLDELKKLQSIYTFDIRHNSEQEIESAFDLTTFLPKKTKYKVKHKISKKQFVTNFGMAELSQFQHTQALINKFEEITKTISIIPE